MKNYFFSLFLFLTSSISSQTLYFPPLIGNEWDTMSIKQLEWCPEKIDSFYSYLELKNSKAFILLKDGKIVMEKYFGSFTQDSLWYWASAGKTLTSALVGIAKNEGFLKLTDSTSKFIGTKWTKCSALEEGKITIWNQITMTSGLDDGVPNNHCTADSCLKCISVPGTRWAYHNAPYTLLDKVIEGATGMNLNIYLNNKIKIKTGITGLFIKTGDDNVFYSKARSMARFGLLILNKGNWSNTNIIDSAYYNQMVTSSQTINNSYGYLWWLNGKSSFMVPGLQLVFPGSLNPNAPSDMFAALGKNGQFINVVPSQNIVFIRLGNAPDNSEVPFTFNDSIWVKIKNLKCPTNTIYSNSAPLFDIKFSIDNNNDLIIHSDKKIKSAFISNTMGHILTQANQNNTIVINNINSGMYIATILYEDGIKISRIISLKL